MLTAAPVALAGLLTIAWLFALIRRWPQVGLWLVGAFAIVAWEFPSPPPLATVGSVAVHWEDIPTVAIALVALTHLDRAARAMRSRVVWVGLALLLLYSLARGASQFGIGHAANEFRLFFYIVVVVWWLVGLDPVRTSQMIKRWLTVIGWCLVLVAIYHLWRYGLGTADTFVTDGDSEQTSRLLVAGQALVLASAGVLHAVERIQGTRRAPWSAIIFIGVAVASQNRSVWLALVAAFAVMFFAADKRTRGRLGLGVVLMATLFGIALFGGALGTFRADLAHSITSTGTYNGRIESWTLLVDQLRNSGLTNELRGLPFGFGFNRYFGNPPVLQTFGPHNFYVYFLLRTGLVGMALWVAIMVGLLRRTLASRDRMAMASLMSALIAYQWVYALTWYAAPVLALVAVAVARDHDRADKRREPARDQVVAGK